jgi:catechol 2,3-dioxygenase-like lactoylglutathione lyase family enzyme
MAPIRLDQVNLVARDVEASRNFYSRLGLDFGDVRDPVWANHHVSAGHGEHVQQEPYDAFWGARYAVVSDPDGNGVGIMSPIDPVTRTEAPSPT